MFRNLLVVLFLSLSVANFSGCIFLAAGAAGAGTAKWMSDKVMQVVNVPVHKASKAAKSALADMNISVYKETEAPDVIQLLAKDVNGRQVWVDLRPVDDNTTKIEVRVGYMNGGHDASVVLDAIAKKAQSWF